MDSQQDFVHLWPNFAPMGHTVPTSQSTRWRIPIQYEHEIYLQLTAPENEGVEKTANQRYLEERERRLHSRANDPAVSGPQSTPSPTDFECAETENLRRVERVSSGSEWTVGAAKTRNMVDKSKRPGKRLS